MDRLSRRDVWSFECLVSKQSGGIAMAAAHPARGCRSVLAERMRPA
jgi:hypothetical protein